ncbi:MAG: hypothetical protein HOV83_08055, partial [Catenulispora sp.]|nr:hypothetical protein [Catenulispora sp.]
VARLVHDRVFLRGVEVVSRRGLWDRWTVTNTLLALAPESVVTQLLREADDFPYGPSAERPPSLATIDRDDDAVFAVAVAHNAPLSRAVVEFVLGTGTPTHMRERQREALASNPAAPDSVLTRLLAPEVRTGELCRRIFRRADADETLCTAIFRMAPYPDFTAEWYASLLAAHPTHAQLAPLRDATDATWVHEAVRQAAVRIEGPGLLACYARLAEMAGLEPVWALELDRVGRIERMDAAVRESMAVGDAGALLRGAGELAASAGPGGSAEPARAVNASGSPVGEPVPGRRSDDVLDDPVAWPLEDAVRAGLDGRFEPWRVAVKTLMSGADDPLPDVVAACAAKG